jgi:hypothetical protein
MEIGPWTGTVPEEYRQFLQERHLTEADVYPILGDPQVLERREVLVLMARYLATAALAEGQEEVDIAARLVEATSPGANANKLIQWLDHRLHTYLDGSATPLPDGILATGVYPLESSFRALNVPRQNGVLLLVGTGCIEFLEYAVSLNLMPEPPFQNEKVELLISAIREFIGRPPRLPVPSDLNGSSWNKVREAVYHGVTWAEWFLLCHEYAHHALGHLQNAHAERYADIHGDFEFVQYSHVQEFEADLWAISMLLCLVSAGAPPLPATTGLAFACAGPFYYLGLLEIMDKARKTSSISYPSAAARIMNLEIFLKSCSLYERQYQYQWWAFNELLDVVSQEIAGSKLIAPSQQDKGLLQDLAQIIARMRPILPGIEAPKPPIEDGSEL